MEATMNASLAYELLRAEAIYGLPDVDPAITPERRAAIVWARRYPEAFRAEKLMQADRADRRRRAQRSPLTRP